MLELDEEPGIVAREDTADRQARHVHATSIKPPPLSETSPPSNVPEYAISELAGALKRTIEDAYGFVRVRGEVSKLFVSRQGHAYLTLKDESAVLEAVCFKNRFEKLALKPEEGLEVVASGKLTTYAGRSQYQLVVEDVRPHGAGALLAQLEERRQRLAAEGLFAAERKRPVPFLPDVVGVITSPTGAVIRDILHRLRDRFPRPVLVWPVTVQGERCPPEVTAAIDGFNALPLNGWPRRPDVLIVARGGGSIEDLWGFNDEAVVRAVARSAIPVISAVGHETDTTLIDHVADLRAPTPTAAAEHAVPVAAELGARIRRDGERLQNAVEHRLATATQTLDTLSERGPRVARRRIDDADRRLATAISRLRTPADQLRERQARLQTARRDLGRAGAQMVDRSQLRLERAGARLVPAAERLKERAETRVAGLKARLDALSYQRTLARGYALVRDAQDRLVGSAEAAAGEATLALQFTDGRVPVRTGESTPKKRPSKPRPKAPAQGSLL